MRKGKGKTKKELLKKWNARLARLGLSIHQGRNPRLIYAGSLTDLAFIEGAERMGIKSKEKG